MPRPLIDRSFGRSGSGLLILRLKKAFADRNPLPALAVILYCSPSAQEDCQYHDENYLPSRGSRSRQRHRATFMYIHYGNHHPGFIKQLINAKSW